MTNDHPDPSSLWRFRRKHSFMAHWLLIVLTVALPTIEVFRPGTVEGVKAMLPVAYGYGVTVILGYIANCAIEKWAEEKWK
mgnify:CR=1 FL=1